MSTLTYLTSLVQQAISRLNNYEANAKKVDELPHQTTLEPTSKIPVSRAGNSEHLTVQQIISSIQNSNYNQLLAVGTITVDGTDIIIPSGVSGQINGLLYGTSADTILSITLCPTGFSRKDIIVLTTANTVVVISGEETDGAIVLAPPVPTDALYITEFDVNDTAIGAPIDPTLGTQFKKKSENSSLKITATGEEQIINLSLGGQMHYIVESSALISVAGFSPHLLNMGGNPLYPGQDLVFENQTGNPITLINAHTIAPIKFNEGADIIVPNGGKIWFRINGGFAKIIMKSWSEVDLSTKLDKVSTAGVERVYTINPDGSQGTKPTSELEKPVFSDTEFYTHTGTISFTVLSEITIPENLIKNNDIWELEIVAKRTTTGFSSSCVLNSNFNTLIDGAGTVSGVQIGNSNRNRIRVTRSFLFKDGQCYWFANSGGFYHDYQSIIPGSNIGFNLSVENKLYTGLRLANSADIGILEYVIFKKIN